MDAITNCIGQLLKLSLLNTSFHKKGGETILVKVVSCCVF